MSAMGQPKGHAMRLVQSSLHQEVADTLREQIFAGLLAPGSFLDEVALCERLQISRTPLREALKVLTAEGLVRHEPRRGSFVNEVTAQDLDEIFPVIALLEGRCAFEAASKAKPTDLKQLRRLHDALEKHAAAHNVDGYYRANHAFHSKVQALAANRWLDRATNDLRRFVRLLRGRQLNWPGRIDQSIGEHRALLAAIEDKEPARAEKLMHDHLMAQLAALKAMRAHEQADKAARHA